jgi:hypothetical protein
LPGKNNRAEFRASFLITKYENRIIGRVIEFPLLRELPFSRPRLLAGSKKSVVISDGKYSAAAVNLDTGDEFAVL